METTGTNKEDEIYDKVKYLLLGHIFMWFADSCMGRIVDEKTVETTIGEILQRLKTPSEPKEENF